MDKKTIAFGDTEIEKHKFHCHKNPSLIDDPDIDKILISNKISNDKRDFKWFFLVTKIVKVLIKLNICIFW